MIRKILLLAMLLAVIPGMGWATNGGQTSNPMAVLQMQDTLQEGLTRVEALTAQLDESAARTWQSQSPEQALLRMLSDESLEEAQRALWQTALQNEEAGMEHIRGALERMATARGTPARLKEQQDRLQTGLSTIGDLSPETEIREIESELTQQQIRRTQLGVELEQKRQTLTRLEEQFRSQPEGIEQLNRELEALRQGSNGLSQPTIETPQQAAQFTAMRRAEARLIAAQLDQQTLMPRIETLRLEIPAIEFELSWINRRIGQLEQEMDARSTEELRGLRIDLQRLIDREPDAEQRFGETITALRLAFDRIGQTQSRVRVLQARRDEYTRIESDLQQTLANVNERLEVSGLTEALGGLFMEEQRRLRRLEDFQLTARSLERDLAQSRLRAISLRERLRLAPTEVMFHADDPASAELARLEQLSISAQLHVEEALSEQLRQLEKRARDNAALVEELQRILRETLLWWPSHIPVGLPWLQTIPAATQDLIEPESWLEIRRALRHITLERPVSMILSLIPVIALYMLGRRVPGHLRLLAEKRQYRFVDNIKLTLQALGWSLLRALPVPVLLLITSKRLSALPDPGYGIEVLVMVMFTVASWWLAAHLLLLFTAPHGVGAAHFNWNALMLRRLRKNLLWLLPSLFCLLVLLALSFGHPSETVLDVFGRMGLLVFIALIGFLLWRLLAPPAENQTLPFSEHRRRLIRFLLSGYILALLILTLAGYLLTVSELLSRTIDTVVILGLVWLGYSLAARALILSETRLRVRRMREQKAKAATTEPGHPGAEGGLDIPTPQLSIEDVNQQTRSLIRVMVGGATILALLFAWSELLPALAWLDGITLWSRTIMVGETEVISRVSLQDFLLAILLGFIFTLAARNLPGLVEILLSRSTFMDTADRYTITTLLRYIMAVVAVISVFSLLGLRWSELQWMVAALTLGLGFGLQEVVANFVSGLIMLFERPVRVGDTITIGEFSGTVARIRTRATTIIDWDNREILVPNKNFITERLINWTLSDTTTRLVISVGVSYSADVDKVRDVLLDIANANEHVMKDPGPTVFFLRFGDSALSFELRVFVSQLRDRMITLSELHTEVIKRFRREGIAIAYPQMDVHVRDLQGLASRNKDGQEPEKPQLGA